MHDKMLIAQSIVTPFECCGQDPTSVTLDDIQHEQQKNVQTKVWIQIRR